jgi:hypothetical protein
MKGNYKMENHEITKAINDTDSIIKQVTEEKADTTKGKMYILTSVEFESMIAQLKKLKDIIISLVKE